MVHRSTLLLRILQTRSHGATPYFHPCNRLFLKNYQQITVEDGRDMTRLLLRARRPVWVHESP